MTHFTRTTHFSAEEGRIAGERYEKERHGVNRPAALWALLYWWGGVTKRLKEPQRKKK